MWLSKVNRASNKMSGLFLFYKPIKRNPYFQLEKQDSRFLVTDKDLLPKNFLSNINYQNSYGYYLENQQNNSGGSSSSGGGGDNSNGLAKLYDDIKSKGFSNVLNDIKEKQNEITQVFNKSKLKEKIESGLPHVSKNDLILEHPNYSCITKLWIRLIPFIPTSWLLKPNESYRIVSLIDPFEPNQISVSTNYNDIENHWNQLESDLLNSLKVLPTIEEKQHRLNSFLNIKIHSFPIKSSSSSYSSSSKINYNQQQQQQQQNINNLKSNVNIVS